MKRSPPENNLLSVTHSSLVSHELRFAEPAPFLRSFVSPAPPYLRPTQATRIAASSSRSREAFTFASSFSPLVIGEKSQRRHPNHRSVGQEVAAPAQQNKPLHQMTGLLHRLPSRMRFPHPQRRCGSGVPRSLAHRRARVNSVNLRQYRIVLYHSRSDSSLPQ